MIFVFEMDTFESLDTFVGALNEFSDSVKFVAVRSTKDFGCDGVYSISILHRSLVKCGSVGRATLITKSDLPTFTLSCYNRPNR